MSIHTMKQGAADKEPEQMVQARKSEEKNKNGPCSCGCYCSSDNIHDSLHDPSHDNLQG